MTLVSFNWLGNAPSVGDWLHIKASGCVINWEDSFKNIASMSSHPQAVFFRSTNNLLISSHVTGCKYIDSIIISPMEPRGDLLIQGIGLASVGPILMKKVVKWFGYNFLSSITVPSLSSNFDWIFGFRCLLIIFLMMDHDFLVLSVWEIIRSLKYFFSAYFNTWFNLFLYDLQTVPFLTDGIFLYLWYNLFLYLIELLRASESLKLPCRISNLSS